MSALTNQFISDAYIGQLHTASVALSTLQTGSTTVIYDGLGSASSLSLGVSGSGATITGRLTAGNVIYPNSSVLITLIDLLYPVGSVFLSVTNTNPGVRFTGTSWDQVAQGRFIAGVGTGLDRNNTSKTYAAGNDNTGEYSHAMTTDEIPSHYHYIATNSQSVDNGPPSLTTDTYLAYARNPAGIGTFEYRLDGLASVANVGRTSDVVRTAAISATPLTNPSYGIYIWRRTA